MFNYIFIANLIILLLFAYFFSVKIHKWSMYLFIISSLIAGVATIFYENPLFSYINEGFLGLSYLVIVMITGAFNKRTKFAKKLFTVRKEYSIIGFTFIIPHGLIFIYYALIGSASLEWFGMISFVIMIPLFITSYHLIKKKMHIKIWYKLQKFAYLSYALLFIHLVITTSTYALQYLIVFGIYFILKQKNYIFKTFPIPKALVTTSLILFAMMQFLNIEFFSSATTVSLVPEIFTLKDGVYRAQATGYKDLIVDLEIEIVNQEIIRITLFDSGCTEEDRNGIYLIAANDLIEDIISSNSSDVDMIAGATHTSDGIIEAVEKALLQAIN